MAAELAGTAAIRLVPSLTGFRARAQTELARQKGLAVDVDIRPRVDTSIAKKQMDAFRAKQQANAINLKAKLDSAQLQRDFQRVEHVFQRSAFAKALRLQIKVIGADALYTLTAAAGAAAAAIDTVVKSAAILPGALAAAGVTAGIFSLALKDVSKAITAVQTENDQAADKVRAFSAAQADSVKAARDVQRAQSDVGKSVRDAIRSYEDLAHAVRGTSLDEADALLNVQESFDKLAQGGFSSITELRRAQIGYARDLHALDGVRIQNKRTLEDFNTAQRQGLSQNPQVVSALDAVSDAQNRVADAANRMADATQTKTSIGAFARLAPSAQEFVRAVTDAHGAWVNFQSAMQQQVFLGQAKNLIDTLNTSMTNLGPSMQNVASQIGGVFLDVGASLRTAVNQQSLKGIVDATAGTLGELRRGLDPLITGFLRMADVGARHLPMLEAMFNRLFDRFNAWTEKIAADGTLDRWITEGIAGVESLVNTTQNIVLIVGDLANAWRVAGGESSGLIKNAEDLTRNIREWTSSSKGQNSLVETFRRARDWISQIANAVQTMWPGIVQIANTVREWSAAFFDILSLALRMTMWVQEHTGLVKLMVLAYLTIRTVAPIWGTLKNAALAYQNVLLKTGTISGPAGAFSRNSVAGLATVQTALGKTGTQAQKFGTTFAATQATAATAIVNTGRVSTQTAQGPLRTLQSAFMNMVTPVNSVQGQIRSLNGFLPPAAGNMTIMGNSASTAAAKVGTSAAAGLWGAAAGLAGFIAPAAIFGVAIFGATTLIENLGAAHREAAAEAENQKNQLLGLKATLDTFSGVATVETATKIATEAQKFALGGAGERNVFQDAARAGNIATPEQIVAAVLPQNTDLRNVLMARLKGVLIDAISKSPAAGAAGLTNEDIAGILIGDEAAKAKLGGRFGGPDEFRKTVLSGTPSLTDLASVGNFINTSAAGLAGDASSRRIGSAAAWGTRKLTPEAAAHYGADATVTATGPDTAQVVVHNAPPGFAEQVPGDVGTATPGTGGDVIISLSPAATRRDTVQQFAGGGMVRGIGSGTSDSNIVRASRGEYIIRKAAVDAVGINRLDNINQMRSFQFGGFPTMPFPLDPVPPVPPVPAPPPITLPTSPPVASPGSGQFPGEPGYRPPLTPPAPVAPPTAPGVGPATAPDSTVPQGVPHLPDTTVPQDNIAYTGPGGTANIPTNYPQLPAPTTGLPYSPYSMTDNTANVTPRTPYGLAPGTDSGGYGNDNGKNFPPWVYELGDAFGVKPSTYPGHQETNRGEVGYAPNPQGLNRAIDWSGSPADMQRFADYVKTVPGMEQVIWNGSGAGTGDNVEIAGGVPQPGYFAEDLAAHGNHVHTRQSLSIPLPGQATGYTTLPNGLQVPYNPTAVPGQPGSGFPGIPGFPGSTGDQQTTWQDLPTRIAAKYAEALKPENIAKFISGQVEHVGQSLAGIGLEFIKGFTGIDFSQAVGIGQQVAGNFTSASGSGGQQSSLQAGSPMDQAVTGDINQFFDPNAGVNISGISSGFAGTPGVSNADTGSLQQLVHQMMIQAGFPESEWPALKNIIENESSWNPTNKNPRSGAFGLFQFLGHENDEYGKMGAYSSDPAQQTRAGLAYIKGRYGSPSAAWAHWQAQKAAGGEGSYARGGGADAGLIRVSRGEYRMSPKAVAYYGVDAMHRLNAMATGGFMSANPVTTKENKDRGNTIWGWDPANPLPQEHWSGWGSRGSGPYMPPPGVTPGAPTDPGHIPWSRLPNIQSPPDMNPIHMFGGFARGGLPWLEGAVQPPHPIPVPVQGPLPSPILPVQPAMPAPVTPGPPSPRPVGPPGGQVTQQAPAPAPPPPPTGPPIGAQAAAPPGELPNVSAFIPGMPTGQQPIPAGMVAPDTRAAWQGPAPASNKHTIGWLDTAIKTGAAHAGQLGALAAGMFPGGGAAGPLIQAGAQMAGDVAAGLMNVLSSAGVGTILGIGTRATPSGTALLPSTPTVGFGGLPDQQQMGKPQPQPVGGPTIMNVYNGGIHTSNLTDWKRQQELKERQQQQPLTANFGV